MNNEKKFLIPEAEIISFSVEDIITGSGLIPGDVAQVDEDDIP